MLRRFGTKGGSVSFSESRIEVEGNGIWKGPGSWRSIREGWSGVGFHSALLWMGAYSACRCIAAMYVRDSGSTKKERVNLSTYKYLYAEDAPWAITRDASANAAGTCPLTHCVHTHSTTLTTPLTDKRAP
ncbi:hypothetical protein KC338_g132 [Hortaea werneckii]|nr:hypothetical protein KC338_g132 [Hortaea werneckii]